MIWDTPHSERDTLYFHSVFTPVPIFQREWEFARLLELYRARRPMRTLEVGTFHGGTLYHLLQNATPGAIVVSVDSYAEKVDNRHLYDGWTPAGVTCVAIEGDSHAPETITQAQFFAPFDLILVDASHLEADVLSDWEAYRPMVAPGGIVAFHDAMPSPHNWLQVSLVWERIQHLGYVTQEIVCDVGLDWSGWGLVWL